MQRSPASVLENAVLQVDDDSAITSAIPIRLFRADPMDYTPFAAAWEDQLAALDVTCVDSPDEATTVVARGEEALIPFARLDKQFLVWTHEPRFSARQQRVAMVPGFCNPILFLNAYTGLIYVDPFLYFTAGPLAFDQAMRAFSDKPLRAAILATFRLHSSLTVNGEERDLMGFRQEVALLLHAKGYCDVYGRGWPESVILSGESRGGNWSSVKKEILQRYAINIAIENTYQRYYISEKIWHAVFWGCLPVYYGADSGIYDVFPHDSFIEAAGKTAEEVADMIGSMGRNEMTDRYEKCLRAVTEVNEPHNAQRLSQERALRRAVDFLRSRRPGVS